MTKPVLEILYDGDCPFCSNYVQMLRLKEHYDCKLLNAREQADRVEHFRAEGMEVSEGFIVTLHGKSYSGAVALSLLSRLTASEGILNRVLAVAFRSERFAHLSYPFMKTGRAMTLRLLGREANIK